MDLHRSQPLALRPGRFTIRIPGAARCAVLDEHNRRLKIYGLRSSLELAHLSEAIRDAHESGATKVILYATTTDRVGWAEAGFTLEGTILGYFGDGGDADIWSSFRIGERRNESERVEHDRVVEAARACERRTARLADRFRCRPGTVDDAAQIAALMRETFREYPDPISPRGVARAIENRSRHFRVVRDESDAIVASASAEIDHANRSAELTDCATRPDARGNGLMSVILQALERDLDDDFGIVDHYTLARADEVAMNCAFAKLGWTYTGRLVNNCRMPNGWESMNIWCRPKTIAD